MTNKNTGPSQRQLRAGELIRRALSEILIREDLRDPDLKGVTVTISEVRPSPDLKHALVFVSPLGGGDTDPVVKGLARCASFLRGRLGYHMEMKSTPRLKFVDDTSFDVASEMNALLARPEVSRDLGQKVSEDRDSQNETDSSF